MTFPSNFFVIKKKIYIYVNYMLLHVIHDYMNKSSKILMMLCVYHKIYLRKENKVEIMFRE